MKATRLLLLMMVPLLPCTAAPEERLAADQLPPAVQRTLNELPQRGPVKQATKIVSDGRAVYLVEVERDNAPNPQLRIAEDGTLLRKPATPYMGTTDIPIVVPGPTDSVHAGINELWTALPPAVQAAAQREANGRDVVDIDEETWNGGTVYEVEFREKGPNARVHVAEDGTVVQDERPRGAVQSFFLGLQLEDTPAPVQETVRRLAGDRDVADVDKERGDAGAPYYRVEIRGPQGVQELRVAPDGKVIYNSREAPPRRG